LHHCSTASATGAEAPACGSRCASIQAWIDAASQATTRSENFFGAGKRPAATSWRNFVRPNGTTASTVGSRTQPAVGRVNGFDKKHLLHLLDVNERRRMEMLQIELSQISEN
jgi:hypothetical protein